MRFLRSSARFLWRVFLRSIAAILLLLLHVVDFYTKVIEPNLPVRWRAELSPYIDRAENWDLYLAWIIIFFAVLYTFYETDSQVTRDPNVLRQLKRFYSESGILLSRHVTNDNDYGQLERDARTFYHTTRAWIAENMEQSSLLRFEDTRMRVPYRHPRPRDDKHQNLLNAFSIYHQNLQALIDSDAWR
jgi:hypothetical protein